VSFIGSARIGAKRSGADPSNAPFLAHIAEQLLGELTPDFLREAFAATLRDGKHPSWFEGEVDVVEWRSFLLRALERWNRDATLGRRVWLVPRRKALPFDPRDKRFGVSPANDGGAS
jgi:hypothetical protein